MDCKPDAAALGDFSASLSCLPLVRATTRDACERHRDRLRIDEPFVAALVTAVAEAFTNIVVHGRRSGGDDRVLLAFGVDARAVTVELYDYGAGFDPDAVPPPVLDDLPESGLGLYLVRSSVDEVDYEPGAPNRLRLRKLFGPRDSP